MKVISISRSPKGLESKLLFQIKGMQGGRGRVGGRVLGWMGGERYGDG